MTNSVELKNLGDGAEVLLYSEIGGWGMTAEEISSQLGNITADRVTVRIHSYGGDAMEGVAIKNVLANHPAEITVVVDGMCASAASIVAMGADRLLMGANSELMIHTAWTFADGEADDLRKQADRLEQVNRNMSEMYAAKAGGDPAEWLEMMRAETWFSADEAVQVGLADGMAARSKDVEVAASAASRVFASFKYSGRRASPRPSILDAPRGEGDKSMDFMASVAQRLGIENASDESLVLAALDETLAEQADDTTVATPVAEETPAEVPADGEQVEPVVDTDGEEDDAPVESTDTDDGSDDDLTVTVDKDRLEQLEAEAEYGRRAREKAKAEEAQAFAQAAFDANKIGAKARARWVKAYLSDPEDAQARMAGIAAGMIHRSETGYAAGSADAQDNDRIDNISTAFGL